jgi:hypothetical protein
MSAAYWANKEKWWRFNKIWHNFIVIDNNLTMKR